MRTFLIIVCCLSFLLPSQAQVKINEICPNNVQLLFDEDGDNEDWFELYNFSDTIVNLGSWYLSDKYNDLTKWKIPNIQIFPGEYVVFFASGKDKKEKVDHWEQLLKAEDQWYVYAENQAPDSSWNQPNFDYSSWTKLPGPFGRNYPNIQTPTFNAATFYIAKSFSIQDTSIINYCRLYMDYDDAFIAYINGVEVARSNIHIDNWPTEHTDIAMDVHESSVNNGNIPEEFFIHKRVLKEVLKEGNNVLSIQVHNAWNNYGDCIAAPYLFFSFSDSVQHYDTLPSWVPYKNYFLHTNFKLSAEMEGVILSDSDTNVISARFFPTIIADHSYACQADTSMNWGICDMPTPGASNITSLYNTYAGKVQNNTSSGFYPSSIQVQLFTYYPKDSIYYTLNGSTPDKNATFYSGPFNIDSTSVLRARVYVDTLLPGPISNYSYFINESKDLPVVSIVTDPENLWDSINGIYVLGPNASSSYPYYGANYWMDWERPAHISFFEKNGQEAFSQDIGIKIHGKISRTYPMKSIRLIAREDYACSEIQYPIFPSKNNTVYKRLILRNSGHDFNNTHFRDAFAHKVVQEKTNIDIQDARPVITYVNGEYWGIYNLREKIDEHYIESNYGIEEKNVDILETYLLTVHGKADDYYTMMEYVKANNPADPIVYDSITRILDIQNFVDYFSVEIYSGNSDWPNNNIKYWKEKGGKWRYIFTDLDASYSLSGSVADNELNRVMHGNIQWCENHILFRRLMLNLNFRNYYINRTADLLNTILHPQHLTDLLDSFVLERQTEMPMHFDRWGSSMTIWQNNVQNMRNFCLHRDDYVRDHIQMEFGLTSQQKIHLNVFPPQGGTIQINTIKPDTFPWEGIYFQDVPIQLKAVPNPGYRFAYWTTDFSTSSFPESFMHDLQAESHATAYFVHDICNDTLLVIDEINYSSASEHDTKDWFEIYNKASGSMYLGAWYIKDSNDNNIFEIPNNTWIGPSQYLVFCRDTAAFKYYNPNVHNFVGEFDFGLSSSSDQIRIYDTNDKLQLYLEYSNTFPWPQNMDDAIETIELNGMDADMNNGNNWFIGCPEGSPGKAYMPCNTAISPYHDSVYCAVSPNPMLGIATLTLMTSEEDIFDVKVYNNLAITVFFTQVILSPYTMHDIKIDLRQQPSGLYFCVITTNNTYQRTIKIVLQ